MHHDPVRFNQARTAAEQFLKLVYFTLFGAVGVYWFVIVQLVDKGVVSPLAQVENISLLKLVLGAVAIADAGLVVYFRYIRISSLLQNAGVDTTLLVRRLRADHLVCFIVAESVAVYGLFLRLLGGTREEAIPFFVAAVALFLLCYPRVPPAPGSPTG